MKIYQLVYGLLSLSLGGMLGCSKDAEHTPVVKDCEKNNYGVVTVQFRSTAVRHTIEVLTGGVNRQKAVALGVASDTVRLRPRTQPLRITGLNAAGQQTGSATQSVTVATCSEQAVSVPL